MRGGRDTECDGVCFSGVDRFFLLTVFLLRWLMVAPSTREGSFLGGDGVSSIAWFVLPSIKIKHSERGARERGFGFVLRAVQGGWMDGWEMRDDGWLGCWVWELGWYGWTDTASGVGVGEREAVHRMSTVLSSQSRE